MVGVAVRRDHQRQPSGALATQEGDHDPPAGIAVRGAGAAVDHHPATVWGSQHNCIPLPHIKKKYGKTTANVEPDDVS